MKQLFLTLAAALLILPAAMNAQCTINTAITTPGTLDPAVLPHGTVGVPYDQDVTFVFPTDTVLFGFTLPFDSFQISTVLMIPSGLSYACNLSACKYVTPTSGINRGCLKLSGTPTTPTMPGDSMIIVVNAWVTVPFVGSQMIADSGKMELVIDAATGVDPFQYEKSKLSVFPNPTNGAAYVGTTIANNTTPLITVMDVTGRQVSSYSPGLVGPGAYSWNILPSGSSLPAGVYTVSVSFDGTTPELRRLTVTE